MIKWCTRHGPLSRGNYPVLLGVCSTLRYVYRYRRIDVYRPPEFPKHAEIYAHTRLKKFLQRGLKPPQSPFTHKYAPDFKCIHRPWTLSIPCTDNSINRVTREQGGRLKRDCLSFRQISKGTIFQSGRFHVIMRKRLYIRAEEGWCDTFKCVENKNILIENIVKRPGNTRK